MVARVQHVDGEYRVVLTPEQVQALQLSDGAAVQILPEPEAHVSEAKTTEPVIRYATNEEALEAYRSTLPQFRAAYEELAK